MTTHGRRKRLTGVASAFENPALAGIGRNGRKGPKWERQYAPRTDVGRVTLPSQADDVCWGLRHWHHHHVIQKAAYPQNTTGENNQIAEQCVEGSTIWWFAAFLFLLGFSTLDMIVKSTSGPATPPVPPAPSSSK